MPVRAVDSDATDVLKTWLRELGLSEFVAVGIETTGLDPDQDRIIEIGAVRFENGEAAASFQSLVNPGRTLDPFVADLTGISNVDLQSSPRFSAVFRDFLRFVDGRPLVLHNPDWQLAFLRIAGRETELPDISDRLLSSRTFLLDPSMVARVFWPELPVFSLSALAAHFRVPYAASRRAEDDAMTSGRLVVDLIRRLPDRVWNELARDLQRLIGSTAHRSRFFFAALKRLASDLKKPQPAGHVSEVQSDTKPPEGDAGTLLGAHGQFELTLSHFRARPAQIEMANAVQQAFEQSDILLVDAPTGVGKSLAYLVPALLWCWSENEDRRQVIVSSHTKVLQEQLHRKDVAEIRAALERPIRAAVLKGRSNYICKRRLKLVLREAAERLSEFDRIQLLPLLRWSELTDSGDISEIGAFNPRSNPMLWSQVSSDSLACSGGVCSSAKGDFHRLAQDRAADAHIVFVNHALLFSDLLRLTSAASGQKRFVLDEAHQIEKAAVAALTTEINPAAYRSVLGQVVEERAAHGLLPNLLRTHRDKLGTEIEDLVPSLVDKARSLYALVRQQFSALSDRIMAADPNAPRAQKVRISYGDGWHRECTRMLDPLHVEWLEFAGRFRQLLIEVSELTGSDRLTQESLGEFRSTADNVFKISDQMDRFLHDDDPNFVRWADAGRSDFGSWSSAYMAPISVGQMLEKTFWPAVGSAVLTSATLATADDFSLVKSSLGLESLEGQDVRELSVGSPFDLQRQMRMIVPMFLPAPRGHEAEFVSELAAMAGGIIASNRRATVILCTSNDTVEKLTAALSPVAIKAGRPLFSQSKTSSTQELLTAYRSHRDGILIGAATFWEGIDLVGDALEILIVSKIPFDVPIDPWIAARCEAVQAAGHDSFTEFSVPSATLRLKQGIGRLIRHSSDRGVAILADPRLFTSRYGQQIRRALPGPVQICRSQDELLTSVSDFFAIAADD